MVGAARTIVAPPGGADFLSDRGFTDVKEAALGVPLPMAPGLKVLPVPAVHDGSRSLRGTRATAVGYLIEWFGRRIYFAGDTDVYPEMAELAPLDLALLPVWGWGPNLGPGHMDPVRAAEAVGLLRPSIAVPIHWGTYFPAAMRSMLPGAAALLTEPPLQFQRLCQDQAAGSRVVVLAPGESLELST
jgi:L-ascorbate metabolism protein UlaG (beta-lactamase superfamily)